MFTKITLENFRSFDHIELDLTEKGNTAKHLAILYGENGAGKTTTMNMVTGYIGATSGSV